MLEYIVRDRGDTERALLFQQLKISGVCDWTKVDVANCFRAFVLQCAISPERIQVSYMKEIHRTTRRTNNRYI